MHVKGCTIGAITLDDCEATNVNASTSVVASSTEEDDFAAHFIQGVEKSRSLTISTKDLAGALSVLNTHQGSKTNFSLTIPAAAESGGSTCISLSATTNGALISDVDISSSHNEEATAQISVVFASTGTASRLSIAEAT